MIAKNKGNPVSNLSKQMMEDTLLRLMQTEKLTEISIQEITDYAGLSRRTFYRNFNTKEDILKGRFMKIWSEYEAVIRQSEDLSMPHIAFMLFSVMQSNIEFLRLVNRQHLLPLFLAEVDDLLPPTFQDVKGPKLNLSDESISYALTFSTGGFLRILIKWLESIPLKTPEEMSVIAKEIMELSN